MTKPPSAWRGHVGRDDLHLDPPLTVEQRVVLVLFFVAMAAMCGVGLVLSVWGVMR